MAALFCYICKMKQIQFATYFLIFIHFLRMIFRRVHSEKQCKNTYPNTWCPLDSSCPLALYYRIGNTLRAIVVYYRNSNGNIIIYSASRLAFPSMFYGNALFCTSNRTPEQYFKILTNSSLLLYNFYIDEYLTAAEAKNILESIKHKPGIDTVTGDIILVPFYQPSEPDFHIPPAGTELRQMPGNANYAADAPKPDSEMLSADGLVHYH